MSCALLCCLSETTVGIIIGSAFTLLGVCTNGIITYYLNRNAHNREVEERKRCEQKKKDDYIKKKREEVYLKFINHYAFLIMLGSMRIALKEDEKQWGEILANFYADDIKAMFRSMARTMSDVSLYGTDNIAIKCGKFMKEWNGKFLSSEKRTLDEYKKIEESLAALLGEMKKELGME